MTTNMNRRSFLKGGALLGGALAAAGLAGCAPQEKGSEAASGAALGATGDATPRFMIAPEPITEFANTYDHGIVVVGGGVAGVSAVMAAAEDGADVALVQKQATPESSGNMAASVTPEVPEAAKSALVSFLIERSNHRSKRELVQAWADNSYDAITWFAEKTSAAGIEVNEGEPEAERDITVNGYEVHLHANTYFGIGHDEVVKALADTMETLGAQCFYNSPAVQLVQDESGRITGVVAQNAEGGYDLHNASVGVVLACGAYETDEEMVAYYSPDSVVLGTGMPGRDGDGHKMALWVGGQMEPAPHAMMVHDWRVCRADAPFLMVNCAGERFMAEGPKQGYINKYLRPFIKQYGDVAHTAYTLVDAKWQDQWTAWHEEDPTIDAHNVKWYFEGNTWVECVEAMHADPDAEGWDVDPAALEKTVARYNELAAKGADDDFGKNPKYLQALDTPPFAIIPRNFDGSLPMGGIIVNADNMVLDANDEPIEGLYAVGNNAGPFYGGTDYPMDVLGLSIGRAITNGYCAGKFLAEK
ncbi:FAD-dependent oxidoreductase [Adlercreutzia caecimuris]|uniref:FAD-dependent oxidoreductase n=1 Tax=Adlercreutzia caecimuris TaxID=671266 RepID=UPI001C3CD6D7|nr:FAD-dependent oxidoreductase [Adlercreutzia caecimuris]